MQKCEFCGSKFGERVCYFCERHCCTLCMTDDRSRCKQCFVQKRKLGWRVFKKYKILLGFIAFIWFYTVFPVPLFADIDPLFYWVTLFAAIVIMIPVGLMVFFWNKNPPGSQGR